MPVNVSVFTLNIHLRYLVPVTRKIIGADAAMPQRKKEKRESASSQGH